MTKWPDGGGAWWAGITCWLRVRSLCERRRANILELSNIQQAVKKERLVRSVHTNWRQSHAVQLKERLKKRTSCPLFLSFFLSLLGRVVSALVTITRWGLVACEASIKQVHLDSTRLGSVRLGWWHRNLSWPTGHKSNYTRRGQRSLWGLSEGWGFRSNRVC